MDISTNDKYYGTSKEGALMTILTSYKRMISNKSFTYLFWSALALSIFGCSTTNNSGRHSAISILAGLSSGGLVENREMSGINGVSNIDTITGATRTFYNAGIHTEINVKGHLIETGLDYISFDQSVKYELPSLSVAGNRDFSFHQLQLPLTYNLQLFKNRQNRPRLILKAGMSVGYTFVELVTENGNIPDYKFTNWDYGPTLGASIYPLQLKENYRLGFYLDLYRGSQIYEDIYHKAEGIGGHSFLKYGILLQLLNLKY